MINRFALSFLCIELDRNEIFRFTGLYILLMPRERKTHRERKREGGLSQFITESARTLCSLHECHREEVWPTSNKERHRLYFCRLDIVERAFQGAYIRRQRQIESRLVILAAFTRAL